MPEAGEVGGEPSITVGETTNDESIALNDEINDDVKDEIDEEDENIVSLGDSDGTDLDVEDVKCAFNDGRGSAQELDFGSSNPALGTFERLHPTSESDQVLCTEEGDLEAS